MVLLLVLGVVLSAAFVLVESRAKEPTLPLSLFSNRVFTVSSIVGFIVGFALFGSVTYIPLYLQVVKGASPTTSGLQLLPLMLGVLAASIGSGQLITHLGRYKVFPIVGTGLMVVGLLLLARLTPGTSTVAADLYMLVLGFGLGFVMQVLILAVQNAADYRDLGVATASATLFRSMGGTIGVPIFGAIFTNQLASKLAAHLPPGAAAGLPSHLGPEQIAKLPDAIRDPYLDAYASALHPVFFIAACLALAAFAFTWLLEERPLRQTVAEQGIGDSFASPRDASSLDELEARLSKLAQRENRRLVYERLAGAAGIDVSPDEAWLLLRVDQGEAVTAGELATRYKLEPGAVAAGLEDLARQELVAGTPDVHLTERGRQAVQSMAAARREALQRFLEDWQPEQHAEVLQLLERFARSLRGAPPAGDPVPA